MISYEEMPDNNSDLADLDVYFPRIKEDSAESCPVSIIEILEYLARVNLCKQEVEPFHGALSSW